MKSKILSLIIAISAMSLAANADSKVETNFVVALKFYFNTDESSVIGDSNKLNYTTGSIKTLDVIEAVGFATGLVFDKAARIIKQDFYDADGNSTGTFFFIRDKFGDYEITDLLSKTQVGGVAKFVYSVSKGTGTYNSITIDTFNFIADPTDADSEQIDATLTNRTAIRTLATLGELYDLQTFSAKTVGFAFFFFPVATTESDFFNGIVEGTISTTGPKRVFVSPVP